MSQALFDQLCFYTLAHRDPRFLHQHAVDAFAVQTAAPDTKPITLVFGLAGLYLHCEKGFTGRQVQLAHMRMARQRKAWPHLTLPPERGSIHIADVIQCEPGPALDEAIEHWALSVWRACAPVHDEIARLIQAEVGVR